MIPFTCRLWGDTQHLSAPTSYWVLKDLMFALCPGLFLFVFAIGVDGVVAWFMWVLAALLKVVPRKL